MSIFLCCSRSFLHLLRQYENNFHFLRVSSVNRGKLIVWHPSIRLYLSVYLDLLITRRTTLLRTHSHASSSASVAPALSQMEIGFGPLVLHRVKALRNIYDYTF
ncbi:hypothetical protein ALC62_12454 [Cyphomyrmex costatus]|uniref:Uncharacterized protein n=1 Tax=Cyphomyrmex costatus TaxID=456900 RepID=A0A151IBK5_9HYME|nr:hypothetical protein ALC62_12454 [Cyphomyrmex costatus]